MKREDLKHVRRLVVKVGTGGLTDSAGRFDPENCRRLAAELAHQARTRQVVLVSSGAIALGSERLGLQRKKGQAWDMPTKQACAAVGQPHLMAEWQQAFQPHGTTVAQLLLTADDLANRRRFLNARHTFARLLETGAIPIVNENDTVAVDEIKVGDNDTLAGLVATCIEAELVVLLTDVDGLYDRDPNTPGARLISDVKAVTPEIEAMAGGAGSERSVGGMATKVKAARQLGEQGIALALLSARATGALGECLAGKEVGTFFAPEAERLRGRQGWLASAAKGRGELLVDDGARKALVESGKSLLPSGVKEVLGQFGIGDPVDISAEHGKPFARGLAGYASDEMKKLAGTKSADIERILGYKYLDELVHRNDLVIL